MTDAELQAHIAATNALISENEKLMDRCKEVVDELREAMAEKLGCSIWDLDNLLGRDLSAEDRQLLEEQAMALLREQLPDLPEPSTSAGENPSGLPAPTGAPRPRRRMV